MFFLGLFELGSLLCGVANSSKMLIIGRAISGMGGSGIVNGALTIISACVPLERRPGTFTLASSFAMRPRLTDHSVSWTNVWK